MRLAKRACELTPGEWKHWSTLVAAHYRASDWQSVLDAQQKSIDLGVDHPINWLFLAMTHWQLGDKAQARKWYDKSIAWRKEKRLVDGVEPFFSEAEKLFGDQPKDKNKPAGQ